MVDADPLGMLCVRGPREGISVLSINLRRSGRARGVQSCVVASVLCAAGAADASVTFSGFGPNPEVSGNASGSAQFTISGNTLTIVLTNTTAPRTAAQGNALTGVSFDLSGASATLTLTSVALTAGSSIWTSATTSNTSDPLSGSWTNVLGASPLNKYGASTSGFGGRFNGGSITRGNSGPNDGIVAPGTFTGSPVSFGGSQFPFIQDSLTLTFTGVAGISESVIKDVDLLFGTDGTGIIKTSIPTPGALALAGVGGLVAVRRKRR